MLDEILTVPSRVAVGYSGKIYIRIDVCPDQIKDVSEAVKERVATRSASRTSAIRIASQSLKEKIDDIKESIHKRASNYSTEMKFKKAGKG
jgi:hypothetical protein